MALTEVYVDPSIAADSGTGTIGDPYGDLEYAIEQTTFDTTNGTRVNIKSGTAEVLAANLATAMNDAVTTPAWNPSASQPCVFQGYTTVAGDGGVATIDGNGAQLFNDAAFDFIQWIDLHLTNSGASYLVDVDDYHTFFRCEFSNSSGGGVQVDNYTNIDSCYFHDITGGLCVNPVFGLTLTNCYIDVDGATGIQSSYHCNIRNNIIKVTGSVSGISVQNGAIVCNNSIIGNGLNTGSGIRVITDGTGAYISNNLIEGFAGAGAEAAWVDAGNTVNTYFAGNAYYNCTSGFTGLIASVSEDNEALTASPFNDAANGDFSPVDVGNVLEGALPQIIGMP